LIKFRYLLALQLLTGIFTTTNGKTPGPSYPVQYELEKVLFHIDEDYGSFNDIAEDQEGFLWLSGTKGINVFDGHSLVSYTKQSPVHPLYEGAAENYGRMIRDTAGIFYIEQTNRSGFLLFNPYTRRSQGQLQINTGTEQLQRISIAPNNFRLGLWLDTRQDHYRIGVLSSAGTGRTLWQGRLEPKGTIHFRFAAGAHWFINEGQVVRLSADGSTIKQYSLPLPNGSIYGVCNDDQRIFFFDYSNKVVYTWNRQTDSIDIYTRISMPWGYKPQVNFQVAGKHFLFANRGMLLVIDSAGAVVQDLSAEMFRVAQIGTQAVELNAIFVSKNGNIWLLSQNSIYRLKTKPALPDIFRQRVLLTNGMPPPMASFRALAQDAEQTIYATYYFNLLRRRKGDSVFTTLPNARLSSMNTHRATYSLNCWKGYLAWDNMLLQPASGQYTVIGNGGRFAGHTTQYLRGDTLWVFPWQSDSLYRYDLVRKQETAVFLDKRIAPEQIGSEELNALAGDNQGRLWMAFKRNGISCVATDGKLVKRYDIAALGLAEEGASSINALQVTSYGIWFGCDVGLGFLDPATGHTALFRNSWVDNGVLKDRRILSLQPDPEGNLYLGSNHGLLYFNTKEHTFFNLPDDHPLSSVEFNRSSALRDKSGRYYFGSTTGLYAFLPQQLSFYPANIRAPRPKIYSISYFSSRSGQYHYLGVDTGGGLSLEPFAGNIEFRLSVPEYDQAVYYSYRVIGMSDKWTPYTTTNRILFYQVPAGDYRLEIKVSTTMSDRNARYYSLPLAVRQVWYKRKWVLTLFALGLLGLISTIIWYISSQRLRQQSGLTALRTRISRDLHDDVGGTLAGVAMQSEMLAYMASAEQKPLLTEISEKSREAMEDMRDIVWAMDSWKDKYEKLIDRMYTYADRSFSVRNIKYEFITGEIDQNRFIDPEKRHMIYLIFKEAVTNILRHSNGNSVTILLAQRSNMFYMTIRDNGQCRTICTDGQGLNNMKIRAEKIGGKLTTSYADGFLVSLEAPVSKRV